MNAAASDSTPGTPERPSLPGSHGAPQSDTTATRPHVVDRHLQAHDSDRVYQAAGNQYIYERPTAGRMPATVMNTLPRDTAAFTGRTEELGTLVAAMTRPASPADVVAIHAIDGMAGVGKSALAVHAGHLLAAHFPDGQLFLNLHAHSADHSPVDPADALFALLSADGMHPEKIPVGIDARAALWRARMAGKRVLLVMDNAGGHAQIEPLLPGAAGCLVLITSRRRLTGLGARHATVTLTLDGLRPDHAVMLFTRLIRRRLTGAETAAVGELMRLCGYLPLAISLLAAKLRPEPLWTVTDLLDDLAATRDRLAQMRAEDVTVTAAFDLSYGRLPAPRQRLFRRLGVHPGTDIDAYAGAALDGINLAESRRHLEALYDDHLLDQPVRGRYRMHDLVRDYARGLADNDPAADRDRAITRVMDYYRHVARLANRYIAPAGVAVAARSLGPRTPTPTFADRRQATTWMSAEMANLLACAEAAKDRDIQPYLIGMSEALAAFLGRSGPWRQAIDLHRAAVFAAHQRRENPARARALGSLGIVLERTGDHANATDVFAEALTIYRRVRDRRGQAEILNELGIVHRLTGRFAEAAAILQQALGIYRDLDDRLGQARTLNNLAVIRWLTDDFPAAAQAAREALAIYRVHEELYGQADAQFHLGVVLRMTDDYPGAARTLHEALAIYLELGHRLGQANTRHNLGQVKRMANDYPGATQALREAFTIYSDLGDRLGQANVLKHLGITRRQMGDLPGAETALDRALRVYRELDDRLGQAGVLHHLGVVRRLAGALPEAAEALHDAMSIYRDLGSRLGQAEVLNHTGELQLDRGDIHQAAQCHARALYLARDVRSALEEARALEGAAHCARHRGEVEEAVESLRQALEIYQRIGVAEAERTSAALTQLVPRHLPDKSA